MKLGEYLNEEPQRLSSLKTPTNSSPLRNLANSLCFAISYVYSTAEKPSNNRIQGQWVETPMTMSQNESFCFVSIECFVTIMERWSLQKTDAEKWDHSCNIFENGVQKHLKEATFQQL